MAKTVWDDMYDAGDESDTRVRDASGRGQARAARGSALPWLLFLLTGAGLAAVLFNGTEDRSHLRADLKTARDEAADFRKSLFVAQDKLFKSEHDKAQEASEAAALRRELVNHGAEKEATDRVIADLRAKLDTKDGDVSSDAKNISVNLVDQILFKSGDADLSPRGKEVLAKLGGVLKNLSDKQILIGGHTDDRPIHTAQFPSNWELSAARAVNVARYLAESVGVDPKHLTAAGFSEFHPRSKKEKSKNRRIEILLTPESALKKP